VKRSIQIVLLLFFITGCGTPLQQPWTDFNAYFNTFYNAERYFNEGLELNQRQTSEINPQVPISIFTPPTQAGREEFSRAIEMGATILRDYKDSKYVEPAIFLIGKSYFYRSEYFSALEKFQEMQMLSTGTREQSAVFWQGITYLQMETYNEGIRFLENELEVIEEWDQNILAETKVLLAQLYINREEWAAGVDLFDEAIPNLEYRNIRSRSYFLYGQALEQLGEYERARDAYSSVNPSHQSYDLVFNAQRKEAEVSRRLGEYDRALEIYSTMERSDKNAESRLDLTYEIARTMQLQGDADEAYEIYKNVLQSRTLQPMPLTKAKTYYGLAEIYQINRQNYEMAAAYYDSAASQNVDRSALPDHFDARELASSFGEYARVKNEINEMDSLLTLGRMEGDEFDAAIAEIEESMQEELDQQRSRRQQVDNSAINIDATDQSAVEASESTEFGFLNIENRALLTDASIQFQAVWGERPLADNWRRSAAVRGSRLTPFTVSDDEVVIDEQVELAAPQPDQIQLDLSAIPFTEREQENMQAQMENRQYQLANIYFLSLNMPDSAKVYYQKITNSNLSPDLIPRSLYSLAEIELSQGNTEKAREWAERLIKDYPNTIFARRTADRLGIELIESVDTNDPSGNGSYHLNMQTDSIKNPAEKAMALHQVAKNELLGDKRAVLLFEAAKLYISAANHSHKDSLKSVSNWFDTKSSWERNSRDLMMRQDSAFSALMDASLSDTEREYWESVADSALTEPDFKSIFPFEGAYWDSTRSVLNEIETSYAPSNVMPKVRILQESIRKPHSGRDYEEVEEPFDEDRISTEPDREIVSCSDMNVPVTISGGIDWFLERIDYPDWAVGSGISGEISYLFNISPDGDIIHYEQASRTDRSGIPQSFEGAIESHLKFESMPVNDNVQCVFSFPYETP